MILQNKIHPHPGGGSSSGKPGSGGAAKDMVRVAVVLVVLAAVYLIYQNHQTADLNNRAVNLIQQEKFNEAVEILKKARVRDPENLNVLRNLAKTYFKVDQKDEAREVYHTILSIVPNDREATERLSQLNADILPEEL